MKILALIALLVGCSSDPMGLIIPANGASRPPVANTNMGMVLLGQSNTVGERQRVSAWPGAPLVHFYLGNVPTLFQPGDVTGGAGINFEGIELQLGLQLSRAGRQIYMAKAAVPATALSACIPAQDWPPNGVSGGEYSATMDAAVDIVVANVDPATPIPLIQLQGEAESSSANPALNQPNGPNNYDTVESIVWARQRARYPGNIFVPIVVGTNPNLIPANFPSLATTINKQMAAVAADVAAGNRALFLSTAKWFPPDAHYLGVQYEGIGVEVANLIFGQGF